MRPVHRDVLVLPVTPLSRGPAVEMIAAEELAKVGVVAHHQILQWCDENEALYHEEDPKRFALDVTAAYALGRGFRRCVFRR